MSMVRPYDHAAVEWINEDGVRECLRCPTRITGFGPTLRHWDEAFRPDAELTAADRALLEAVAEVGARALEAMPTDRVTDYDRAWLMAQEMWRAGMVRQAA